MEISGPIIQDSQKITKRYRFAWCAIGEKLSIFWRARYEILSGVIFRSLSCTELVRTARSENYQPFPACAGTSSPPTRGQV